MTEKEKEEFICEIKKSIMPYAQKMSNEQIQNLINAVQKQNPTLPFGFGNMLLEQIKNLKYVKKSNI